MTRKSTIYDLFLKKIELDKDFFAYYKMTDEEVVALVQKRCDNYYSEAIIKFMTFVESSKDLFKEVHLVDTQNNIDEMVIEQDLTPIEINLVASLMREVHYERDVMKLKAMMLRFTPKDLNVFSPANERKTFMDMFEKIQKDNRVLIDRYNAMDRVTGRRKKITDYVE